MKKTYCTPEIIIVATADLCWTENPFGNSVEHGSAKDFKFEEKEDDFTMGLDWGLWDKDGLWGKDR